MVPSKLIVFFILPLFIVVSLSGSYVLDSGYIDGLIYLNWHYILLGVGLISFLLLGTVFPQRRNLTLSNQNNMIPDYYLDICFYIAFVAYLIWFKGALSQFNLISAVLFGSKGAVHLVRETFETIAGITTLTQIGIVFSCFYSSKLLANQPIKRKHTIFLVVLLILTLFRAVLWSERLALIEFIFPLLLAKAILFSSENKVYKFLLMWAPYWGIFLLLLMFGAFEYNRSWINYYQHHYDSYTEFIIERVFSYYFVALNNGAGLIEELNAASYAVFYTLQPIYKFPFLGEIILSYINVTSPTYYFLSTYANLELNNMSGIYTIYFDYNWFSFILFFLIGVIYKFFYNAYRHHPARIIASTYPILLLSLIEVLRINYLFSVRLFPVFLFTIIIYIINYYVQRKNCC